MLIEIFPVVAAGQATTGSPVLLGIGFAPITPVEAAGLATTSTMSAVAFWPITPVVAAGVANTSSPGGSGGPLSLVAIGQLLPMIRGETRQVLSGAAVGETSAITYENSGRVGGKRHGAEVQISRDSGAGDVTVEVQGRADANAPWAVLFSLTLLAANETAVVEEVPMLSQFRLEVTVAAAATVNAWILV